MGAARKSKSLEKKYKLGNNGEGDIYILMATAVIGSIK